MTMGLLAGGSIPTLVLPLKGRRQLSDSGYRLDHTRMRFLKNPIGRKLIMALSGFSMIAFVLAHLLGNASLYSGPNGINAYANTLHSFPPFVWAFRIVMLSLLILHVFFGIQLTLENNRAKPQNMPSGQTLSSTFASRNMIWSGLLIAAFLVYHLSILRSRSSTRSLRRRAMRTLSDVRMCSPWWFRNFRSLSVSSSMSARWEPWVFICCTASRAPSRRRV